jgi:hypothetical protein
MVSFSRKKSTHTKSGGYLMLLALVFGAIFVTVLGALTGVTVGQNKFQNRSTGNIQAIGLAEAGIEYYRWFLAHNPGNLTNGTSTPGPYTISYNDPEGGLVGSASLAIQGNISCGVITSIDIDSTGIPLNSSGASETIHARYTQPSVGLFSYIINDSVHAGSDRIINGPYHSNGGVFMEGTTNAPVSSSLSTWLCTPSLGCSPSTTVAGVYGTGSKLLWKYPVPQVDFAGITSNFTSLKTVAQSSGLYFPRYSTGTGTSTSSYNGYHLTFNTPGTVTVKRVSATTALNAIPINNTEGSLITDRSLIATETLYNTYNIPPTCGLIFVEDNTWIEGSIPRKVTLVAANTNVTSGVKPNLFLKNNILYTATSSGLAAIAHNNVLITPDSPTTMSLSGIFIAQNGSFGRNYFFNSTRSDCHPTYEPKTLLTIKGSTVSNHRTGTQWNNGCSGGDAGYATRLDAFDRKLSIDPPPFTPKTSTDYKIFDWRQK